MTWLVADASISLAECATFSSVGTALGNFLQPMYVLLCLNFYLIVKSCVSRPTMSSGIASKSLICSLRNQAKVKRGME